MSHYRISLASILTYILLLHSCTEAPLERALTLAGDNRSELEKVLKHYSADPADSLKYKAACFLIENAPYHFSFNGTAVDKYRAHFDSIVCNEMIGKWELVKRLNDYALDTDGINIVHDINSLSADFLIAHIEDAFMVMSFPWTRNLSFDDFCEYVLPYRIGNEGLENWMSFYRNYNADAIDSLRHIRDNDLLNVSTVLFNVGSQRPFVLTLDGIMKVELNPSDYTKTGAGDCPVLTRLGAYSYRSIGIPVSYDYILNWANRSMAHAWNSITIDSINYAFTFKDRDGFGKNLEQRAKERLGKVYRKMFSFQHQSLVNQKGTVDEGIPEVFNDPCMKDVSEQYFDATDVKIKLVSNIAKKNFVFLMVFNNREWVPVGWGRVRRGKAIFENIEKGCAYIAMYYHKGRFIPASDPFSITADGIFRVHTPKEHLTAVRLKRKYTEWDGASFLPRLEGGRIQIANTSDFRDAKTIYTVGILTETSPHYVDVDENTSFKYIRYLSSPGSYVWINELEFWDGEGNELKGRIIGTESSSDNGESDKFKAFDGNPLTLFSARTKSVGWVGMAFDSPQTIGRIMLLPWNDDNHICFGEQYELYYWNEGKFTSLGKRIGDRSHVLEYDNVPVNSLFLLRNHSKGKEERIFTFENGKQVWW
jgi:hypothetical protein